MEQRRLTDDTLRALALGCDPGTVRHACLTSEPVLGSAARSLASMAAFWDGDFVTASDDAACALATATSGDRPLALAVTALALAGDPSAWQPGSDEVFAQLRGTVGGTSRSAHLVRYIAAALLEGHPPTSDAWSNHPIAVVMQANAIRVAAFSGRITEASSCSRGCTPSSRPLHRTAGSRHWPARSMPWCAGTPRVPHSPRDSTCRWCHGTTSTAAPAC